MPTSGNLTLHIFSILYQSRAKFVNCIIVPHFDQLYVFHKQKISMKKLRWIWKSGVTVGYYILSICGWLTVSAFIDRKRPSDVIDNIMLHWVGAGFGIMKSIITDNRGGFSSDEMREVCSILNVQISTTAANSPFQNGLCERTHAVTDTMFLKLWEQCPKTPIEVYFLGPMYHVILFKCGTVLVVIS